MSVHGDDYLTASEFVSSQSSSLPTNLDFDDDCLATDADLAASVYIRMLADPKYGTDIDNDGVISAQDTLAHIEEILYKSFGDVNKSGAVTTQDVSDTLDAAASTSGDPTSADVTGDATVDTNDVIAVTSVISGGGDGSPVDSEKLTFAAQQIYYSIGLISDDVDAGNIGAHTAVVAACGAPANWPRPRPHTLTMSIISDPPDQRPHLPIVSRTYPTNHVRELSTVFPTNHMYTITTEWAPSINCLDLGHQDYCVAPDDWPHNHFEPTSDTWDTPLPGDEDSLWPENHSISTTANWREEWRDHPSHTVPISLSWPSEHDRGVSSQWPPNHTMTHSSTGVPNPSDHETSISGTWPTEHDQAVSSSEWPPSHHGTASASWGSHASALSATWPSSHGKQVSGSWPRDIVPGYWPPNHNGKVSKDWHEGEWPTWDPQLWPLDHGMMSTIQLPGDLFN